MSDVGIDLVGSVAAMRGVNDALADRIVEINIQDIVVPYASLTTIEPVFVLGQEEPVEEPRLLDTSLCYICGRSNYADVHLDEEGFARACPTGILRSQADDVRRARGEVVR